MEFNELICGIRDRLLMYSYAFVRTAEGYDIYYLNKLVVSIIDNGDWVDIVKPAGQIMFVNTEDRECQPDRLAQCVDNIRRDHGL